MSTRPIVIRKVIKMGRDGRPKVARDRKLWIKMERVEAQVEKQCLGCRLPIRPGSEHAVITGLTGRRGGYGPLTWPESQVYHFGCVPAPALPLVRFFISKT